MLKSIFASLLLIAVLPTFGGTAGAQAFVSPPEQSYRVISPPEHPYRDLWQTDAPYPRNIKWDFDQDPTVSVDAVYAGWEDPVLMGSDAVTFDGSVSWFSGSGMIGIDNSSGAAALEGKAVFHVADHARDWPWVKHLWLEIVFSASPPAAGARVVARILGPAGCGLADAGSSSSNNPDNPGEARADYWYWLGPSPAWEKVELLIRAEAGEQVWVDSVHIATESVMDPVLCETTGLCVFYRDTDGDTYGDPNSAVSAYDQPAGYVTNPDDCDDTDGDINPGATETCNSVDDNCDGNIDEGCATYYQDSDSDTYGNEAVSQVATSQPAGYATNAGDCDDTDANVNPGATEICNGIDDNCHGNIDEGCVTYYRDADGDTYGDPGDSVTDTSQPEGCVANAGDCDDTNGNINPGATETCNGVDDDCDGNIDEGCVTYYQDSDGDTYGNPAVSQVATSQPAGYVTGSSDCDDTDANVNPGATETCNGVDDNCDGNVDEDTFPPVPDLAELPTVRGQCSATMTTVVTATDNCAGTVTGTTTDPLSYTEQGTYTVTWTFDDGNGNSTTQIQTVIVKDLTPPTVTAVLAPVSGDDDDGGLFRVQFSTEDNCDAAPYVKALIKACRNKRIPVTIGQRIEIERDDDCEVEWDDGILEIEARSAVLEVTAEDFSGNVGTDTAAPQFRGADDDDRDKKRFKRPRRRSWKYHRRERDDD